jgi:hypothetical protein
MDADLRSARWHRPADGGAGRMSSDVETATQRLNESKGGGAMSATEVDELGPVDYVVVEFPADKSNFSGEMASALSDLIDRKLVRVLDLLVLRKENDGSVEAYELEELEDSEIGELRALEAGLASVLAEEDVEAVAAALEPGSTAGLLVWENTWAAPFASAVRRSGGQLVASGRIPIQAIVAAIEADEKVAEGA